MTAFERIKHLKHKELSASQSEVTFKCSVHSLDEYSPGFIIDVEKHREGQWLFDEVCERFGGVQEKDYFGLRYIDKHKQRQWLDLNKNILHQLKDCHADVRFRVKHYPKDPINDMKQQISKYMVYLQLRRDLYSGRLLGKSSELYELAALVAQSEFSDFEECESDERDENYLTGTKILPNLNPRMEAKIIEIHKTLAGMTTSEAESMFLEKASQLETYGVEPFYVKDRKGNNLYVGLTHSGVSTFQGSRRAHLFKWEDIFKMHYDGKLFILQVILDESENGLSIQKKHVLGFKCESPHAAAALWEWAIDRQNFYTLNRSSEAKQHKSGGGLFKRSKSFRFSGKCHREVLAHSASLAGMPQPQFERSRSLDALSRSISTDILARRVSTGRGGGTLPNRFARRNSSKTTINVAQSEALDDLFNKSKYDLQDNSERELKENAEQESSVQDKNMTSHDSTEEICRRPILSSTAYTPSPVESLLLPDDRATETSFPFDESHESSEQKVLVKGEEEVKNGSIPSSSNDSSKKDAAIQAISLENRSSKSSSVCNQLVWMLVTLCFLVLLAGVVMSALFETTTDHSKLPPLLQAIYMDYYQPIKSQLL